MVQVTIFLPTNPKPIVLNPSNYAELLYNLKLVLGKHRTASAYVKLPLGYVQLTRVQVQQLLKLGQTLAYSFKSIDTHKRAGIGMPTPFIFKVDPRNRKRAWKLIIQYHKAKSKANTLNTNHHNIFKVEVNH